MSGILSHVMAGGRLGPNLVFDNANAILAQAEWNTVQVILLPDGSFAFVGTNVGGPTRWAAAAPTPGPGSEVRLVAILKFGVGAISLVFQFDGITYTSGETPWVDFDPSVGLTLSPSVLDTGGASFIMEIRDKVTLQTISREGSLQIIAP